MRISTAARATPRWSIRFGPYALALLCFGLLASCGGNRLTSEDAYSKLEPKSELPEAERPNQPDNLVVRVFNVADARVSYKNYVVLYINDRAVEAPEGLTNLTAVYTYSLRLREGVYDVRAEYHAVGSWRRRVFDIVPAEQVKVLPNQRTILEARLQKDERGGLAKSPARFRVQYETVTAAVPIP